QSLSRARTATMTAAPARAAVPRTRSPSPPPGTRSWRESRRSLPRPPGEEATVAWLGRYAPQRHGASRPNPKRRPCDPVAEELTHLVTPAPGDTPSAAVCVPPSVGRWCRGGCGARLGWHLPRASGLRRLVSLRRLTARWRWEALGQAANPGVHVPDQQHGEHRQGHDQEPAERAGQAGRPGVAEVVLRQLN